MRMVARQFVHYNYYPLLGVSTIGDSTLFGGTSLTLFGTADYFPCMSIVSVISPLSLVCRKNRSRATSLEIGSELYRKVLKPLDQPPRKGRKYAIGVIISLSEMSHLHIKHFKDFIFSHFTLINTHLERLKEGVEEALLSRVEPQRQNVLSRAARVSGLAPSPTASTPHPQTPYSLTLCVCMSTAT
jgi:hypothetical protein